MFLESSLLPHAIGQSLSQAQPDFSGEGQRPVPKGKGCWEVLAAFPPRASEMTGAEDPGCLVFCALLPRRCLAATLSFRPPTSLPPGRACKG